MTTGLVGRPRKPAEVKVLENLSEEEAYLFAILSDPSGLDQAEFLWVDYSSEDNKFCPHCGTEHSGVHTIDHPELAPEEWVHKYPSPSECFRAWAFQWPWWRDESGHQVDQSARSIGKSLSIKVRGCAFPFLHPGAEMVITAPELVHLEPIVGLIETQCYATRTLREMIPPGKSAFTHRPFQANFRNGARIIGRIPQRDGKGVKGLHPIWLELDESQDYPHAGWIELNETLKRGFEGAMWRAHGVTRGVRDDFYEITQDRPENHWKVHRFCLPANAMVFGVDEPVPMGEIEVGHRVWSVDLSPEGDGDLVEAKVSGKASMGRRNTWRVTTRDREIVSTPDHRMLIMSRRGTRRTRRDLAVTWARADQIQPGDFLVQMRSAPDAGRPDHDCDDITEMLSAHSPVRRLPPSIWHGSRAQQRAFLAGYLMGDGSLSHQTIGQDCWQIGTACERMCRELQALFIYNGFRATKVRPNRAVLREHGGLSNNEQWRFYVYPMEAHFRQIPSTYANPRENELGEPPMAMGEHLYCRKVMTSEPTGVYEEVFDIEVEGPENFVADGVVVHNCAMWRPTWTDVERQQAIQKYGSREDPDYRRNILGLHGDKTNPIFVLTQLMKNVDNDPLSDYNAGEYFMKVIKSEKLELFGQTIIDELDFPLGHLSYAGSTPQERQTHPKAIYWVGMDVGFTIDPSEILVFCEYKPKASGHSVLRLLTRLSLVRMPHREQIHAILHTIDFYRPKAFALDRGGVGLPLFQEMQEHVEALRSGELERVPAWMARYDLESALTTVKGYSFGEKLLVELDKTVEFSPNDSMQDMAQKAGLRRNAKEYSTDTLRELVDAQRLWLPWDEDLLQQFQGGTWTSNRSMDAYGRRVFSHGNDHVLDAARFAALAWSLNSMEELMRTSPQQPVLDVAILPW